jgi:Putative esterase
MLHRSCGLRTGPACQEVGSCIRRFEAKSCKRIGLLVFTRLPDTLGKGNRILLSSYSMVRSTATQTTLSFRRLAVLDNLIATHRIPPTMAVLVDNMSQKLRDRDLRCSTAFERFILQEVLPWMRRHYRVSSKPSDVVITGSSDGGLFAIFAGLHDPAAFGNVLAQSSDLFYSPTDEPTLNAYTRDGGWLTRKFMTKLRLPLRVFSTSDSWKQV